MKWFKQIPNLLTLANLFMGLLAIVMLIEGKNDVVVYLIAGCLIADIFDGMLARKMGVDGELGIQLDSLADVVSFGALPSLMYYYIASQFITSSGMHSISIALACLIGVSAGLRLARFNVDTRPREYFWGLATPAGAMLVTGLFWGIDAFRDVRESVPYMNVLLLFIPIFLAIAYQVALKLPGLKSPKAGKIIAAVIAVLTLIGFFLIGPISIALGIFLYVMLGVVNLFIKIY